MLNGTHLRGEAFTVVLHVVEGHKEEVKEEIVQDLKEVKVFKEADQIVEVDKTGASETKEVVFEVVEETLSRDEIDINLSIDYTTTRKSTLG